MKRITMALLRRLIDLNAIDMLENANILLNENRRFRQRFDPFELSDFKFIKLFRLNKEMVERVIYIVEEYSDRVARRSQLDAEDKVQNLILLYKKNVIFIIRIRYRLHIIT